MPNKLLERISIIDTPGILTAAKRKLSRGEENRLIDYNQEESLCLDVKLCFFLCDSLKVQCSRLSQTLLFHPRFWSSSITPLII